MDKSKPYVESLYGIMDRGEIQSRIENDPSIVNGNVFCSFANDSMRTVFQNANVTKDESKHFSAAVVWGHGSYWKALEIAERDKCPLILCEDGFIRSIDTWCNNKTSYRNTQSVSMTMDTHGYYFDAQRNNRLVTMLNSDEMVSEENRNLAHKLINNIILNKVSKYNHQPFDISDKNIGHHSKKVLVVDQSYGDFSVKRGGADENTFSKMLYDAIHDNEDADILVKVHPDSIAPGTTRKGYYQNIKAEGNVIPISFPCNPFSLLEKVDKVYVCSSQLGFEALMAGKDVVVYGRPFYAGWGLTDDKQDFSKNRLQKRTLEELVYFTYYRYVIWYNPDTHRRCGVDEAINWIISNRGIVEKAFNINKVSKPSISAVPKSQYDNPYFVGAYKGG